MYGLAHKGYAGCYDLMRAAVCFCPTPRANKAAYTSAIVLLVAWVAFR